VPIEEFEPLPNCYYLLTSSESILTDPVLITWYPAKFRHHSIAKIYTNWSRVDYVISSQV